ncbi:putative repeat protein (TIGR01451 family)/gliding motility-associated-like protein [Roseivirga pacifica]|uniref:Conserved repeat domain-containing protein/gliding motility-associated C-terminal domain-containing protein n=1 Tax=Roseivirga pacifica TaxID=1267423 RepID=A0A1I0R9F7_9BACT|nr:gliding motility-associated C-terminal domain-containing protein [Roseivirga pacifica]RKQ49256.1 putative repeat protein (TIGR01451 family)/gliding motility-associated-like protein [Roseivirga pacifica]SEW37409.1 conserved repeat domain-containing protein/gliding motility-associated C-terminal domain-containing protein [Roseivirga pacifica]
MSTNDLSSTLWCASIGNTVRAVFIAIFLLAPFLTNAQNCSVNAGIDASFCINEDVTLSGGASGKITGATTWALESGPSVVIENPNDLNTRVLGVQAGQTYVFKLSATCEDGSTVSQTVNVEVLPITESQVQPFNDSCPGTYSIQANSPGANETGEWVFQNGANDAQLTVLDVSNPSTNVILPEGSFGTTNLVWRITNANGCVSEDVISITNYGTEDPVSAGSDQILSNCFTVTTATNLNGSFAGDGQGEWSFVSGPAYPTFDNINDPGARVSGLVEGTYTFRWTVSGPCVTGSDEVTVTVPAGTQNVTNAEVAVANHFFCSPVSQVTLEGNAPVYAGERVLWEQVSGPAGVVFNPNNQPTTLVTGLDGSSTYKFRYSIINDNTGCNTISGDVTVQYFLQAPSITVNSGNALEGTCNDLEVEVPFTFTGGNKTEWRIISGPYTTNFKSVGGNTLTYEFEESGVYELMFKRFTTTNGEVVECGVAFDVATVVVANQPTPSNPGTNQTLDCSVTSTELVANAAEEGDGQWSQVEGPSTATITSPTSQKTTVSNLVPGVYKFRWLISTELICGDEQNDITVTVSGANPTTPNAGSDKLICYSTDFQLNGNTPGDGETGLWTVSPSTGVTISNTAIANPTVSGLQPSTNYTFTWTISNACGESSDAVLVRTNSTEGPTTPDAGEDQCLIQGGSAITSFTMDANEITKGIGRWEQVSGPNTLTITDVNDPKTTMTGATLGVYELAWIAREVLFPSCGEATDTVEVTISEQLVSDAGPDQSVCADNFTMAAVLPAGSSGQWVQIVGNAGWTVDDITSPTATFSNVLPGNYVFDWVVSNGSCTQAVDEVNIVLYESPAVADAGANRIDGDGGALCQQSAYTMQATSPAVGSGTWSVVSGPNSPNFSSYSDPNANVSNLISGEYVFRWTVSTGVGECPPDTDDVTIQVVAPMSAGNDQNLCDVTNYTLKANEGAVGTWTQVGGPAVASLVTTSDNTATVVMTPGNSYQFQFSTSARFGCVGQFDVVTINNGASIAETPDAGPDQSVCTDNPALTINMAGVAPIQPGVEGTWTIVEQPEGSTASFDNENDPNAELLNFQAGTYVIEWTFDFTIPGALDCSQPKTDVMKVFVYDPGQAQVGPDKATCIGEEVQLDALPPAAGIGTWTLEAFDGGAIPAGVVISSPNLYNTTVTGLSQTGTYTFRWTVTSGNDVCPPSIADQEVFIAPAPDTPDAGPDQEICPTVSTGITTTMAANAVVNGQWQFVSGPTTANFTDATNPTTEVTNLTAGTYQFNWVSNSAVAGCSLSDAVIVKVNPVISQAEAGPDITTQTNATINLEATEPVSGTGTWSVVSGDPGLSFVDANDPKTAVTGAVIGTYELRWTVSGGGACANSTDDMILTVIGVADLSLEKTVSNSSPNLDEVVTFSITVSNDGPNDATGVAIRDVLPLGYALETIQNGGSSNGSTILWNNLTVPNGSSTTVTFTASVRSVRIREDATQLVYYNIAEVIASDQFDPDSSPNNDDGDQSEDDEDFEQVDTQSANLSLEKTVSNATPNVNEAVTFTIKVKNDGPNEATHVVIQDLLPLGYEVVTINDGGVQVGRRINWPFRDIADGATASVSFVAKVLAPTDDGILFYKNIAQVAAADQADLNSTPNNFDDLQLEDDEDTISVVPLKADLSLVKSVAQSGPYNIGDVLDFKLTLSNAGPNDASGVAIQDVLPNGYEYQANSASNGGFTSGDTLAWSGLAIANGATVELTYKAKVVAPQGQATSYKNVAQVTASDQYDPDSEPNNDSGLQLEDDESALILTPQFIDLSLSKEVDQLTPLLESNIVFTITVSNDGPSNATGVVVKDLLPTGYQYLADNGEGAYNPSTGLWQIGALDHGETRVLNIQAKVTQEGTLSNGAEVIEADQFDIDSTPNNNKLEEDDQDVVRTTQDGLIDVSLTKTVDNSSPLIGQNVVFTLVLANDGPSEASGLIVRDVLLSGFSYVSHTGGIYNPTTGSWQAGTLGAGESKTLEITASINATGEYTNLAQVMFHNEVDRDSSPANGVIDEDDQDGVVLTPQALIDLSVEKTVDNPTPDVGTIVTFTVEVNNLGPSEASGIEVTDLLPSGYTYLSYSSSTGTYNQFTGLWELDNAIAADEQEFLLIKARVLPTGDRENTAEVTAINETDADLSNNISSVTTVPVDVVDIEVVKHVTSTQPFVGSNVTFSVTVVNNGPSDATNVTVEDLLASGFTYVSDVPGKGTYDVLSGHWAIGDLAAEEEQVLLITALVNPTGIYVNTAELINLDQKDIDSSPNNGVLSEDDMDAKTVTPQDLVDVSITKTVSNATPRVGSLISFEVKVENSGTNLTTATNLVVTDLLPTGYTLVTSLASGGSYNALTGDWFIGALNNGDSETLSLYARVLPTGEYDNTAELTGLTQPDIDSEVDNNDSNEDDQATVVVTPTPVSDLSVDVAYAKQDPFIGELINLNIEVTNNGPSDATNVLIEAQLPSGLEFDGYTATSGLVDGANGLWSLNNLPAGTSENVTILAKVKTDASTDPYKIIAQVIASDNEDPDSLPDNDEPTEDDYDEDNLTPVDVADLSLTKTVDNATHVVGDPVTFTLTLTNDGPSDANNILVEDLLPNGYTFVSSTGDGTYDEQYWSVPSLANGATATLSISARVNPSGNYQNVAEVIAVDELDPDSSPNNGLATEDDQDLVETSVNAKIDVSLTKSVDNVNPHIGDAVTFTLEVTNAGPNVASNVSVRDELASGFIYESHTGDGTYSPLTSEWIVGGLTVGDVKTLTITATVNSTGSYVNIAEVTGHTELDSDSSPGNNKLSEDDQDAVTVVPVEALDIRVQKMVDNATPNVGDQLTFTVGVSNIGATAASGIKISDVLPDGLQYVSNSTTNGIYNYELGLWTLTEALTSQESTALQITAKVLETFTADGYRNIAKLQTVSGLDTDASNNADTVTITPVSIADLSVEVTSNVIRPSIGSNATFTVKLTNSGPSTANNIQVENVLGDGLSLVSTTPAAGVDLVTGIWSIATLGPNQSVTLQGEATVLPTGDYGLIAEVIAVDEQDLDSTPGNGIDTEDDQDTITLVPVSLVDVSLSAAFSAANPLVGDQEEFVITVVNDGPSVATGVNVSAELGTGFQLVASTAQNGTYTASSKIWQIGTLNAGEQTTLTLTVLIRDAGKYTLVADVSSLNENDVDSEPGNFNFAEDDGTQEVIVPTKTLDLVVTNAVSNQTPLAGALVEFTIGLENEGPSIAQNVVVSAPLPAGYNLIRTVPSVGTYNATTGEWTLSSTLISGAKATLLVQASVLPSAAPADYSYTASLQNYTPTGLDNDATNNTATVSPTPQQTIDLELSATADNLYPKVGEQIVVTWVLENKGPSDASNVSVETGTGNGLSYVSSNGDGTVDVPNKLWNIGALASGTSVSIDVTYEVLKTGLYGVGSEVKTASPDDIDSTPGNKSGGEDDQAVLYVFPTELVDVSLSASVNNSTPNVGDEVTFTITVDNAGPSDATGLVISGILADGLAYVSNTVSNGSFVPASSAWSLSGLAEGATETLTITATVLDAGAYRLNTQLTKLNQNDVDSSPGNNDPTEDDQAVVTITPQSVLDLVVTKTATNSSPKVGGLAEFNVSVANQGVSTASAVQVEDVLPAGFSFVSFTSTSGQYNAANGIWTINTDILSGETESLKLVAKVVEAAAAQYENTAEITSYQPANTDVDLTNNSASITLTPIPQIDLELRKRASKYLPNAGEEIDFTITVVNKGPSTATGVVVTSPIATGYSFVSADQPGNYDRASGEWNVGTLAPGQSAQLIIKVNVLSNGDYTSFAEVIAADQEDEDSTPNNGDRTEDDIALVPVMEQDLVDVSLTKTVDNAAPNVGTNVNFTVTVTNDGPSTATGVAITDRLGDGLQFVSSTASQGTYNETGAVWTVGTLASGASATLMMTALVQESGDYVNVAEVTSSQKNDLDSSPNNNNSSEDDQAEVTIAPVEVLDLQVVKTTSNASPLIGQPVGFSITVTNNGPSTAQYIEVTDLLNPGFQFVTATATNGKYNKTTGVWALSEPLGVGESEVLQLAATVLENPDPNSYINTAEITDYLPAGADTDATNNTSSITLTPKSAIDLSLTKSTNKPIPQVGDLVTYTLAVTNAGPSTATGVSAESILPSGLQFVSSSAPSNYNATTGIWSIGTVAKDETKKLLIDAIVLASGDYELAAEIVAANEEDLDSTPDNGDEEEDDYDSVVILPRALVDISLAMVVDNATPTVGSNVTFTLTLTNDGPSDATGVNLTNRLGSGFSLVSATVSTGSINESTGSWNVGGLTAGATAELTVQAQVLSTGVYTNTGELTGLTEVDVDSSPSNNDPNEDDQESITITPVRVLDLVVTNSVTNSTPVVNEVVEFDVSLSNAGPSAATGVSITDLLPSGYAFVSYTATNGSYVESTGVWTLNGSIISGQTEELKIFARVLEDTPANYQTTAAITAYAPAGTDVDVSNNTASATITPIVQVDLEVLMEVSKIIPTVGERVTFTLSVGNRGPSTATGVVVNDLLPSGVSFVSANPSADYNDAIGDWTVGSLAAGEIKRLQVVVDVLAAGDYENTMEVTAANETDVDSTPNNGVVDEDDYTSITLFEIGLVDVSLAQTASNLNPVVDDEVTFTVSASNDGPSDATGLNVLHTLGSGLTYKSSTASDGTYDANTGTWQIGGLVNGNTATLTITATVDNAGEYTSLVAVSAQNEKDVDSAPANNNVFEDDEVLLTLEPIRALDISVSKSVSNTTPTIGDAIEFDVVVANTGPSYGGNVVVRDLLPAGYTYLTSTVTAGTYNSASGLWNLNSLLLPGQTESMKLFARVVEVNNPSQYTNTATLVGYLPANADTDASNNQASVQVSPVAQIDLEVSMDADDLAPFVNEEVVVTTTLENKGPSTATQVRVAVPIPSGYTVVSANSANYNSNTGIWTINSLAANASQELILRLEVEATGDYDLSAEVIAAGQSDSDSSPNDQMGDDYAELDLDIQKLVDLVLTSVVSNTTPETGEVITFTFTLMNQGPSIATGVIVSGNLGTGLSIVNYSASQGSFDPTTRAWIVGTMDVGDTEAQTLEIQAQVNASGTFTAVGQVTSVNENAVSVPANNDPTEADHTEINNIVPIPVFDLIVTNSVSNSTPIVNKVVEFDITLSNAGPSSATGVVVTDLLPAGYTFVSYTATNGTYVEGNGNWLLNGSITSGQSEALKIFARVLEAAATDYETTASISAYAPSGADTDATNDQAVVQVTPIPQIDLEVSMTADNMSPTVAEEVVVTTTIENNGPSTATQIQVSVPIPSGYTVVSSSTGNYNSSTGVWTINSLAVGASQELILRLEVEATGDYDLSAEVIGAGQNDSDSSPNDQMGDDYAELDLDIQKLVDLVLTSAVSNTAPETGEVITFTFTLMNQGPSVATGVIVSGNLGTGFSFVSYTASQGTFDPVTRAWVVGTMEVGAGEAATLEIQAQVNASGTYTAVGQVTSVNENAVSTPANNDPTEADHSEINDIIPSNAIDLSLSSSADSNTPFVGSQVTANFAVLNQSLNPASGVVIGFKIPDGLRVVNTSQAFDEVSSTWTVVGGVDSGQGKEITFIFEVLDEAASYEVTAEVIAADQNDVDSTPNNGDTTEDDYTSLTYQPVSAIDLELAVSSDIRPVIGTETTLIVELKNTGASVAEQVEVATSIPDGYLLIDDFASKGIYDNNAGIWSIDRLAKDEVIRLELTVEVGREDSYNFCAEVISAIGVDIDSTPNNNILSEDDQACVEAYPIVQIKIPEGFTPNGDGINDVFRIENLEVNYPNFRYEIFNRWGDKLYSYQHNGDPTAEPEWWDGRSTQGRTINDDKVSASATYYYVIHFNDSDREPITGWVYVNY